MTFFRLTKKDEQKAGYTEEEIVIQAYGHYPKNTRHYENAKNRLLFFAFFTFFVTLQTHKQSNVTIPYLPYFATAKISLPSQSQIVLLCLV